MDKKEYIQPKIRCKMLLCSSIAVGSINAKDEDADPNKPMMSKDYFEFAGDDISSED